MTTVILSSTKHPDGLPDQADVTTRGFGTTETITEQMLPTESCATWGANGLDVLEKKTSGKLQRRLLVHATSVDQLATEAAMLELSGEETRIAPFVAPDSFWRNEDGHRRAHQTSNVVAPPQPMAYQTSNVVAPSQPMVLYK